MDLTLLNNYNGIFLTSTYLVNYTLQCFLWVIHSEMFLLNCFQHHFTHLFLDQLVHHSRANDKMEHRGNYHLSVTYHPVLETFCYSFITLVIDHGSTFSTWTTAVQEGGSLVSYQDNQGIGNKCQLCYKIYPTVSFKSLNYLYVWPWFIYSTPYCTYRFSSVGHEHRMSTVLLIIKRLEYDLFNSINVSLWVFTMPFLENICVTIGLPWCYWVTPIRLWQLKMSTCPFIYMAGLVNY